MTTTSRTNGTIPGSTFTNPDVDARADGPIEIEDSTVHTIDTIGQVGDDIHLFIETADLMEAIPESLAVAAPIVSAAGFTVGITAAFVASVNQGYDMQTEAVLDRALTPQSDPTDAHEAGVRASFRATIGLGGPHPDRAPPGREADFRAGYAEGTRMLSETAPLVVDKARDFSRGYLAFFERWNRPPQDDFGQAGYRIAAAVDHAHPHDGAAIARAVHASKMAGVAAAVAGRLADPAVRERARTDMAFADGVHWAETHRAEIEESRSRVARSRAH